MSMPTHIPPLEAQRIATVAANDWVRSVRLCRRKRAAAALGALAVASGVTGAIDILGNSTAGANNSNLSVGRLTIALANHDGFKLDTCRGNSPDSSANGGDNTGGSNDNDTNYTDTVVVDDRTITIGYEDENDYIDVTTSLSNNNANNQNIGTRSDETIRGINVPNETLSAWTDEDHENPFLLKYRLNEREDDDVGLPRLNEMITETVLSEAIPGINAPNETIDSWIGENGGNPFILEYRLNQDDGVGRLLFRVGEMTEEEQQEEQAAREIEIIQENIWRFSN
ncbi:hypothetical protein B1987_19425 [Mycobacterium kansasii]|uniref:Uncharacterized protein n=1 Tax=Mycobacterium attenuatum TaxID=2341086 RepID=A0A498QCK4_9MYCO|nr:hypothetical protein [Mycobacterium attenuatum]ORB83043.1 hypothetical protein B1987_03420 [Mycobacterium kansasii]ORB85604.1 hypothetical protein B1987_19425 [Mycobacterium kansasii]VBA42175.1 hypothetical protein LAUMK136_04443 [Mycobacterium attenuatum]VBA58232.1 hypothetical protein LAUMK191_04437 [Mycobacterium attenuatum]